MKKKRMFRDYEEKLYEDLKNRKFASTYLNIALMDEDPRVFLLALKDVYEAQDENMTELAQKANITRENLYRILSKKGNPKLTNVVSLLNAVGFSLGVNLSKKS